MAHGVAGDIKLWYHEWVKSMENVLLRWNSVQRFRQRAKYYRNTPVVGIIILYSTRHAVIFTDSISAINSIKNTYNPSDHP